MKFEYKPPQQTVKESFIPNMIERKLTKPDESDPVIQSIGIHCGPTGWVMFVMETQGNKIISYKETQDNLRSTTIDNFKITASKMFMED